ncbi:hypothetical protein M409DRAFT_50395 [Zasmidium cellare ATCC 36951]|uniref:PAZ domain-containing protein n=1 Tax=Zasmidium cellare ATCC 36951 TaxID=1080233 RepID=A0A6A6CX88_ZASCE|nr:uncharacterized protein M409DRAFT_50395 [Zasmidium cellare ATCC 36951]KAF2171741.1 hypothetical protein M409DRAFT_50395 [Zasmidium cellare ATCC 36951]
MSSNTGNFKYADIDIEAGIQNFKPLRIKVDEKHIYCVASDDQTRRIKIAGENTEKLKDDARLYKAERKLIERILVKQAADKYGQQIIPVNNARFLVRPHSTTTQTPHQSDQSYPLRNTTDNAPGKRLIDPANVGQDQNEVPKSDIKFSAIVITWNGRGSPPEQLGHFTAAAKSESIKLSKPLQDHLFERVWNHGRDSTTQLRFHWTKVVLFKRNDDLDAPQVLQNLWNVLREKTNTSEFTLHHVPCKVYKQELSMRDALLQMQWAPGANLVDQGYWYDIVHALLKAEFGDQENSAIHGEKFYDLGKNKNTNKRLQGLLHCVGKHRNVFLNAAHEPMLEEGVCPKLFFMPGSVADFMVEHFGTGSDKQIARQLALLQEALRGKLVRFKADGSKITKAIESVSSSTGANVENHEMHPSWRGKIGLTLQHRNLPCINVGTKYRPALLPPEMVMLVPGQSFKRPITPSLRREIVDLRQRNADNKVGEMRLSEVGMVSRMEQPTPKKRNVQLAELIQESVGNQTQLMYITAGIESVEMPLWTKFQSYLRKALNPDDKDEAKSARTVFLQHKPGQDVVSFWKRQLTNAKNNAKSQGGKHPIAVVILRDDMYHAYLYKVIKTLCDTDVGLQCFFIKVSTLEQKKVKVNDDNRAAEMTAKVIAKKVAVRNPKEPKALEGDEALNLSVAIHIERVTVNAPKPKPDGTLARGSQAAKTVYVVVLSSRDTEKSDRYCTKTELVGPENIQDFPLEDRVKDFVQEIVTKSKLNPALQHRVVILRSGYMPRSEARDVPAGRRLPVQQIYTFPSTTDVNNKDIYTVDDDDTEANRTLVKVFNMNQAINSEVSTFRDIITAVVGSHTLVSYVLVSQDKSFEFTESTKKTIEHAVAQMAEAEGTKALKESFFITDTRVNPSRNSIGTHRSVHVKNNASVVTLTLLGEPLADDESDPVSGKQDIQKFDFPEASAKTPRTEKAANVPKKATRQSTGSNPENRKGTPQRAPVSQSPFGNSSFSGSLRASSQSLLSPLGPPSRSFREAENLKSSTNQENFSFDGYNDGQKSPSPKPFLATPSPKQNDTITIQKNALPSNIKNAELTRLAKLWYDDRLELYNTKLPIPTHLAYLAAKRAQLHMRYDNFDDDADDAAPCALDPIHDDVKDTLYFL